jgi:hypothetical protein
VNLEDIKALIQSQGIRCRESSTALTLNHCPACGTHKFKVAFALKTLDRGFLGKCFRGKCQEGFSIYKYLLMAGVPRKEIELITGTNPEVMLEAMSVSNDIFSSGLVKNHIELDTEDPPSVSEVAKIVDGFIKLSAWPDHPATRYALSRGVDLVRDSAYTRINPIANSVVFLCNNEKGECIGFQERYLEPPYPDMKTKTLSGFDAHSNIMYFDGSGDIAICEGPFTAIAALNMGFAAITTFGSGVSMQQMKAMERMAKAKNKHLAIAFDMDDAGRKGSDRMERLFAINETPYYIIEPEVGNDLSDSWAAGGSFKIVNNRIENAYIPQIQLLGL